MSLNSGCDFTGGLGLRNFWIGDWNWGSWRHDYCGWIEDVANMSEGTCLGCMTGIWRFVLWLGRWDQELWLGSGTVTWIRNCDCECESFQGLDWNQSQICMSSFYDRHHLVLIAISRAQIVRVTKAGGCSICPPVLCIKFVHCVAVASQSVAFCLVALTAVL